MQSPATCALCGQPRPLVDSHVVPQAFWKAGEATGGAARLLTNTPGEYPRRVRTGLYGQFVCLECEQSFGPYDDYAKRLLFDEYDNRKMLHDRGQQVAFLLPPPDYAKLKLFFVITLWRAHWCKHEFYSRIRLGPKEGELKEMIRTADPGTP